MIEDGEKILFISMNRGYRLIEIVKAFAIGQRAVTSQRMSWVANIDDDDRIKRDILNWGVLYDEDEGIRWCRGWDGEAARALLAAEALSRPADKQLARSEPVEGRDL